MRLESALDNADVDDDWEHISAEIRPGTKRSVGFKDTCRFFSLKHAHAMV
jgi:hypothetical protein